MNNILVFYQSKYGATKLYMDMLKEKLDCDIVSTKNYIPGMEKDYEKILFAGGVYAGAISVMKFLRKNGENFKDKKLAVFAVGVSEPHEDVIRFLKKQNLASLPFDIPLFYGRGIYDETKMTFLDKRLCKTIRKVLTSKNPDTLDPTMKALLNIKGEKADFLNKDYLNPMITFF